MTDDFASDIEAADFNNLCQANTAQDPHSKWASHHHPHYLAKLHKPTPEISGVKPDHMAPDRYDSNPAKCQRFLLQFLLYFSSKDEIAQIAKPADR